MSRLYCCFFAALLLFAVPRPAVAMSFDATGTPDNPAGKLAAEAEPNDDKVHASPITAGEKLRATIEPRDDADWYRVAVDSQGALAVKIDRVPANLDATFQVFDEAGGLVRSWVPTRGNGQPLQSVVDLKTPGTYYLEVRDAGNNASSPDAYELSLAFSSTADTGEANDELAAASPIPVGKTTEANILPRNDADWYWLAVGHQGALEVAVRRVPLELDVTFQVFDGTGGLVQSWVPTRGNGQPLQKVVDLKTRGTYYLEVRDAGNNGRSSDPYVLAVGFSATADDGEPNDTPETALPIAAGDTLRANILPLDDADWYRLAVAGPGDLQVSIREVPSELNATFQLFDEQGKLLQAWVPPRGAGEAIEHVVRLPAAGAYYIEVRDGGNNARSSDAYSLSTSFSADATEGRGDR